MIESKSLCIYSNSNLNHQADRIGFNSHFKFDIYSAVEIFVYKNKFRLAIPVILRIHQKYNYRN